MIAPRSTVQREYDTPEYRKERKRWRIIVDQQGALCVRCHRPINPGDPFDTDHSDDRTRIVGPSHPHCNRGAGGRKARARERMRIRRWRSRNW